MVNIRNAFVTLLFSALFSATMGQCDHSDYHNDYSPEVAPICYMLYEELEQALVTDHLNLYKLRRVFFPNAKADPVVVAITYNINFSNITDEICTGVNTKENNTISETYSTNITWTSYVTFSVLDPQVIVWLLPSLVYIIDPIHRYFRDSRTDLLLPLTVPFLSCTPSEKQVVDALMDLTTKLKVFANAQKEVSSSDSIYKGYAVQGNAKRLAYAVFYVPTLLLLIFICLLYIKLTIKESATRYLQKITAGKTYYLLIVSAYSATTLFTILYISLEVLGLILWAFIPAAVGPIATKFVVFIFFCVVITFMPAHYIGKNFPDLTIDQLPMKFVLVVCPCLFCCKCPKKCLGILVSWNLLIFISILTWNFIPFFILALVNPVRTLAVLLLSFTIFFVFYTMTLAWFSLNILFVLRKRCCSCCLNMLMAMALGIPLLMMIAFVVYLLREGGSTSGVLVIILALIPGMISGFAVWLSKKIVSRVNSSYIDIDGEQPQTV